MGLMGVRAHQERYNCDLYTQKDRNITTEDVVQSAVPDSVSRMLANNIAATANYATSASLLPLSNFTTTQLLLEVRHCFLSFTSLLRHFSLLFILIYFDVDILVC